MSKKHFSVLAVLTAVVVVIAFLLPGETARESGIEQEALLPDLEAQVNDVDWLRISAGGDVLATAVRRDGQWLIEESGGYPADWPQIQQLLAGLSSAVVLEAKTANPEYYGRLGVDDPGSPDGSGILVEFAEATGLPAVIVGNTANGRDGQYLRLAGSAQSVLVDVELELPRTAEDWLEREVTDIADSEVVEVEITGADGESVLASKVSADDADFTLQNVPEGFEPNSSWAVNSLAGGLSSLRLEAVAPASNLDWSGAVRYRVLTADGLTVEAELVAETEAGDAGEEHWLRIAAGTRTTAVEDGVDEAAAAATAERAAAINARAFGWAYRVPKYTFESMTKRMEDLVRETEATE
jgi:hypothetical protein